MAHTYEELKGKTVEQLREIAKSLDHESVRGATQMNKEHLLPILCKALGIDTHVHHQVEGIDKPAIKTKMKELKKQGRRARGARCRTPQEHSSAAASLQPSNTCASAVRAPKYTCRVQRTVRLAGGGSCEHRSKNVREILGRWGRRRIRSSVAPPCLGPSGSGTHLS